MPIRNRHRVGRYLVLDDESGFVHYDDEVRKIWDGSIRHKRNFETRNPQEFVRAKSDPRALRDVRPEPDVAAPDTSFNQYVGKTTVLKPTGAAAHLFDNTMLTIPDMVIGSSFTVT